MEEASPINLQSHFVSVCLAPPEAHYSLSYSHYQFVDEGLDFLALFSNFPKPTDDSHLCLSESFPLVPHQGCFQ